MSEWNFMGHDSKDTLLRVVRQDAEAFFATVSQPEVWEAPTAHAWQVRDVVGHLVDTTEAYFVSFDAARGTGTAPEPLGLADMGRYVDEGARAFRSTSQAELIDWLRAAFEKMMGHRLGPIPGGLGRPDGPAQVHGAAARLLLPRVPAGRLRGAQLGHPPGRRPRARDQRRRGRSADPALFRAVVGHLDLQPGRSRPRSASA